MTFKDWIFGIGIETLQPSEFLFKTNHIITLVMVAVVATTLAVVFRKNNKAQKKILNSIIGILLFFEISTRIVNIIALNEYTFTKLYKIIMPCHFCSIAVVAIIISYFAKWSGLKNACVVGGFLGTLVFLIYPGVGFNTNIITFSQIYSILSHSLGFIFCVLMTSYKQVDFNIKKIYQPIIFYVCVIIYSLLLNLVLFPGSNYSYFMQNELGLNVSIHLYRFMMLCILIFEIVCCYVPPLIKKSIINKKVKAH